MAAGAPDAPSPWCPITNLDDDELDELLTEMLCGTEDEVNSAAELSGLLETSAAGPSFEREWRIAGKEHNFHRSARLVARCRFTSDSLALASDGDEIAFVGGDGEWATVSVCSASSGEAVRHLRGHTDRVACVACDGDRIASSGKDKTIRLWSRSSGACTATIDEASDEVVFGLAMRGNLLLSGEGLAERSAECARAKLWQLKDEEGGSTSACVLATFAEHAGPIRSVALSEHVACTASQDSSVRVYDHEDIDMAEGALTPSVATLEHPSGFGCYSVCVDGDLIASSCGDGRVRLWRLMGSGGGGGGGDGGADGGAADGGATSAWGARRVASFEHSSATAGHPVTVSLLLACGVVVSSGAWRDGIKVRARCAAMPPTMLWSCACLPCMPPACLLHASFTPSICGPCACTPPCALYAPVYAPVYARLTLCAQVWSIAEGACVASVGGDESAVGSMRGVLASPLGFIATLAHTDRQNGDEMGLHIWWPGTGGRARMDRARRAAAAAEAEATRQAQATKEAKAMAWEEAKAEAERLRLRRILREDTRRRRRPLHGRTPLLSPAVRAIVEAATAGVAGEPGGGLLGGGGRP